MQSRAVLSLVLALVSPALPAQTPDLSQALKERVSAFQTAWNAHDAVAVSALFTADADQLMGDGPVTQGTNALQQWWRDRFAAMPKGTSIVFTVRSVRVITPDVAPLNVLA